MQKFSCVIVDDEPIAAKYLALFVDKIEDLNLVKTFSNPVEALDYLEKEQIDLVFLDIQMPRLSGIEIAKKISQKSLFIFTLLILNMQLKVLIWKRPIIYLNQFHTTDFSKQAKKQLIY
ncbi:MAG: response regulator [Bacteroidetes bacterium]|nr:response regulator [Bacteroidota bacterium]